MTAAVAEAALPTPAPIQPRDPRRGRNFMLFSRVRERLQRVHDAPGRAWWLALVESTRSIDAIICMRVLPVDEKGGAVVRDGRLAGALIAAEGHVPSQAVDARAP